MAACSWGRMQQAGWVRHAPVGVDRSQARGCCCHAAALPKVWTEVQAWASQQFQEQTRRPDAHIHLAKASLLLALEEESCVDIHPEVRELLLTMSDLRVSTNAGASTWSLARLDFLASSVRDLLMQPLLQDNPLPPDSTAQQPLQQQPQQQSEPQLQQQPQAEIEPLPPEIVRTEPMRVLRAINTVLFEWQGYTACSRAHGHSLASVLEQGQGCSSYQTILYLEVAKRLGVHLAACPLDIDEGRSSYWVLIPEEPLTLPSLDGGETERLVIDPFGKGSLLRESEVCEFFEVTPDQLKPASKRQLLICLLTDQRDAWWARAIGCSPSPSVLPLSLDTALSSKVKACNGHALERTLAAQEKLVWLAPSGAEDRCFSPLPNGARRAARLKLALLHLHARHWDEAYHGLNDWLHSQGSSGEGGIPEGESKESQAVEGEGAPEADRVVEEAERDRALVLLEKIRLVSEAH